MVKKIIWTFENALSLDLRSLALSRIATGIILLLDLIYRAEDIVMFYTDKGVLSREQLIEHFPQEWRWSLHMLGGNQELQLILFGAAAIFAVMLIVGWKTRVATIASWVLLISLQNRNPMVLNAGDVTFRLLLLWAMFLPWGEYFSIDSLIRNKKTKRIKHFSVATFAFIGQLALTYWFSLLYKSGVQWTTDFTSLYLALSLDLFTTRAGYILYQFPELMKFLTFAVMRTELIAPILLFVPYFAGAIRTVGVLAIIGMHIGFALFMEIGVFPFVHIAFALGILGSMFWDELLPAVRGFIKFRLLKIRVPNAFKAWLQNQRQGYREPMLSKPASKLAGLALDLVAGLLFIYIVLWNIGGLPDKNSQIPVNLHFVADALRIDQKWNMFSPYPLLDDGWYILKVEKSDGELVDFYRGEKPLSYEKPELVSGEQFPNQRWRKYIMNLYTKSNSYQRPYFVNYMCRLWREEHPEDPQVKMEFIYMLERTLPNYKVSRPEPVVLYSRTC